MQTKLSQFHLTKADQMTGVISGYAGVTNVLDLDGEIVDRGAFADTLKETGGRVPVLWSHDRARPCGWV